MKLLVDGAAFQLAGSDGVRIWQSLLPALSTQSDLDVMVLDRGGLPPLLGATRIPFPSYKNRYTADDSALIQHICDFYEIDVFTSTHHTTPLSTPMFLVVHDMPELSAMDPNDRPQQEKAIAIAYARHRIALSAYTRDALLASYPTLDSIEVARAGIDHQVFKPADESLVATFRRRIGFDERPYLITYDRQEGKNATLLIDTIAKFGVDAFDILCVGYRGTNDRRTAAVLPAAVKIAWIDAASEDIAVALSGAAALIHPSLYGSSGLPVLEAMACGSPVVTTSHGALSEVAGDACMILDSVSHAALAGALTQLRSDTVREDLRHAGLKHAATFDWSFLATAVIAAARNTAALRHDAAYQTFAETWQSLRLMQASVDTAAWTPSV